jgi:hypothetical protein
MTGMLLDGPGFRRALARHTEKVNRREGVMFRNTVEHVERSIKFGSETTGAPGQPVRSGNLLKSFFRSGSLRSRNVTIAADLTKAPYAPLIENNPNDMQLRSEVGGFHSIKITKINFRWIVRYELAVAKALVP